ncbi:DUF4105 domain-containing protein [Massilia sp. TN1-12]|uniref:Lnb N-terminal periplasmic domain-containing protein n=1 Tax=Massilia paldalensis TaxID=3377675 RepID=UPI00384B4383
MTLALAVLGAWGAGALWFQLLPRPAALAAVPCWILLALSAACAPWAWPGRRRTRALLAAFAGAALVLLAWWQSLAPSHDRVWADDVARLLEADVDGDRVVLRNVRNFDWVTETRYAPRWETRAYDLSRLVSGDLILSYWMGPHIAHTLVSFGFDDGRKLVFSLEIRKERQESFSAVGGFFREFEQVIIAADESDIVRTRSNVRKEDVYMYRLRATPAQLRTLFKAYLERAERLRRQPEFYNTLTSNCTTIVFDLARQIDPGLPLDIRLLLSGHVDEYAYDQHALTPGVPFAELRRRAYIDERARRADRDDSRSFSQAIRVGIPGVPAAETR